MPTFQDLAMTQLTGEQLKEWWRTDPPVTREMWLSVCDKITRAEAENARLRQERRYLLDGLGGLYMAAVVTEREGGTLQPDAIKDVIEEVGRWVEEVRKQTESEGGAE